MNVSWLESEKRRTSMKMSFVNCVVNQETLQKFRALADYRITLYLRQLKVDQSFIQSRLS